MDAILLAAGVGNRMKQIFPKQFVTILGKPMFIYALEALRSSRHIENIIITCNVEHRDVYEKYVQEYNIKNIIYVEGGKTRQESVLIGLQNIATERVLIHEAARPLIALDFINLIINSYQQDAVIPVVPIPFSIVQGISVIEKELDRSRLKNVQLPQVFDTQKLIHAHHQAVKDHYQATEDGMLLFHYGGKVHLVEGRESNLKVTTPLDLEVVERLINLK